MSKRGFLLIVALLAAGGLGLTSAVAEYGGGKAEQAKAGAGDWALDATYIEACSCHLFCPCYFNPSPEHPYCEFNMAV